MVHNLSCAILGAIQPLRLTELDLKFSADMVQAGDVVGAVRWLNATR